MKRPLLSTGIVMTSCGVLSFLFALLSLKIYNFSQDGSSELYSGMYQNVKVFSTVGLAFTLFGVTCLVILFRIKYKNQK